MERAKKVHLVGAGGVGMAALAWLLKRSGCDVTGCDIRLGERTRWLEACGIKVFKGHDPSHVRDADEIIATPAALRGNPELAGKDATMRGEALARIVSSRESIAVCGTHGKTTTATWTAKLLRALGEDAAWAIGGETGSFACAGGGDGPLVVEADESDGTLALYHATTLVVTNCEFDHSEHFKDFAQYKACFDSARANAGDVVEAETLPPLDGGEFSFLSHLAPHNMRNARAAAEVALRRGHARNAVAAALAEIVGNLPDRRFEYVWRGAHTVIDDYAHHPTEMAAAIGMARAVCKGKLRVIFQPHRHSRTKALLENFPAAFADADETAICPVYAAFAPAEEGGSAADLYAECRRRGVKGLKLARSCREAWRHAWLEAQDGDVTLLLGAGDIIDIVREAKRDLALDAPHGVRKPLAGLSFFRTGGSTTGGGAKRFAGMGSNLWISDFTTDEEYVFAPQTPHGPGIYGGGVAGAELGIPWMAGVPGTVGGWTKMNAGAHGHSISECIIRVKSGGRWIDRDDCGFGYRTSAIDGMIEEVEFAAPLPAGAASEYLARRPRFPARCCGSVFKNPPGDAAGRLLEAAGAKGMSVGGAFVWDEHANVIAAGEGATSSDILALAEILRARVELRFGTRLEYEIAGPGEIP